MQFRFKQVKTAPAPTFLAGAGINNKRSRYEVCRSTRGFRYDIGYYYQILKKTRRTPILPHLSVRHEARALALFIADEDFTRQHLWIYLGVVSDRAATLTRIARAYNVDYKKRDLLAPEVK